MNPCVEGAGPGVTFFRAPQREEGRALTSFRRPGDWSAEGRVLTPKLVGCACGRGVGSAAGAAGSQVCAASRAFAGGGVSQFAGALEPVTCLYAASARPADL